MIVRTKIMRCFCFDEKYKIGADFKLLIQLWQNESIVIKKISIPIAFFSDSGVGSREKLNRINEHKEILNELALESDLRRNLLNIDFKSVFKCYMKNLLKKLRLWAVVERKRGTVAHKCDWEKCRWCK